MRFQKAIKRMIALGTGAVMLSSMAGSAFAAADLANYPSPFIKDGKFNGLLIVGDKAAVEDVIGISDIISSLQFAATTKVTTTKPGAVSVEGDAWRVGSDAGKTGSSKRLELSEDLSAGGINRETLSNITNFIQKGDLKALDSGSITNSKVTSPYNQYLYLLGPVGQANMDTGYVIYTQNDQDTTQDFLYFKSGREIGRYLLELTTSLESDVDDSTGASSATGLFLTDYQNVDVMMLGKKYSIVTAKRTSTVGSNIELTLMGGAGRDTLLEKATKTYTVNGKDYEVTLTYVGTDGAQFTINGENTRKLNKGDTDKLSDKTTVGVSEILFQNFAGGIHSATFFLGAQKLVLKDTDVTNTGAGETAIKVDDRSISNAVAIIEGSDTNSTFKLNRISVNMTADDNLYVPAGGKLSDTIKAVSTSSKPEVLFTQNWDVEYRGLSTETTDTVKVRTSGSSQYNLEFTDGDGNKVSVPIAKAPSGNSLRFGEQDGSRSFINKENRSISKDDYFVLSDSTAGRKRGERPTYVLQYKGADKVTNDNPTLRFRNMGGGSTIEQTYTNSSVTTIVGPDGVNALTKLATLKVGGSDFAVYAVNDIKSNDFQIALDLDASGAITSVSNGSNSYGTAPVVITTKSGMEINVTNETSTLGENVNNVVFLTFRVPDESRDGTARDSVETLQASVMRWNITASSAKVALSQDTTTESRRINLRTPSGKSNVAYAWDSYGDYYTYETPTSDPALITIAVPAKQRVPMVYITAAGTSFSQSGTTSTDAVTVQRIQVGAAKLASEISDVKAQNVILVGGPCANAVAATLMGNTVDCTTGFTPGEGMVQIWEHTNGNVAMLVAGYSAVDTRNTAAVVANYGDYKGQLKGMKVIVKKVSNQLTVAAPPVKTIV